MIARASQWTAVDIVDAVGGHLLATPERPLEGVCTDTRDALDGQVFVALRGDRFDAHDFLDKALDGGAAALIIERGVVSQDKLQHLQAHVGVIEVEDTLVALGDLARAHRRRMAVPVFALTGSNGKTTTKEMVAGILGSGRHVLKTAGNLNNLIGLPMTLLGLDATHAAAVVEMGMNALGEIARLTEIAEPDAGLVLNVAPAHIGMLGSIEAIAQAKGELFAGLSSRAVAVVNADDPRVAAPAGSTVRRFGRADGVDVRLTHSQSAPGGQTVHILVDGKPLEAFVPFAGAHNALNATAAIALATAPITGFAPVTPEQIVRGLAGAAQIAGRLQIETIGEYRVVDDCYNANAASMIAAIDTVASEIATGRFVAVLGEMRELGEFSDAEHRRVSDALLARGAALVVAFGPDAKPFLQDGLTGRHEATDVDGLFEWLAARLEPGDTILVKGSRGIRMERFIQRLRDGAS